MIGLKVARNLVLPIDLATEPIGVLANRGRGKTYATHVLVEEIHDAGVPVVILDIKGDWWGVRSSADGRRDGMPFYIFGGDHQDLPLEPTAGELLADLVVDERVSVVLDLSHMSKTKARSFTVAFAERLYHRNRDPLYLVVDEADVLIPQRATADTARLLGAMEDIGKRGRGRGIGMAVVTQRPQEVAKSVLDLMDTLVLLGMTGRLALKTVSEWISVHVDEDTSAKEVMATLPSLPVGTAWVWSPMHHLLERIDVRPLRTFDSHPTPKVGEQRETPKARAALNLEDLGGRIAATVERAKADDPTALKARIRELEQAQAVVEPTIVHVPTITAEILSDLTATTGPLLELLTTIRDQLGLVDTKLPTEEQSGSDPVGATRPTSNPGDTAASADVVSDQLQHGGSRGRREAPGSSTTRSPAADGPPAAAGDRPHLKAGARRILEAIARQHPIRVTRSQLATLARFKITGGTWRTYWSTIQRAGLVDEDSGQITLTPAGWAYLGLEPADQVPTTGAEVLAQYSSVLKAGARAMLEVLVDHRDGIDRDYLAELVAMEPTGGTFRTYLSTLRRNGLAEVHGETVRPADVLFLGAAS